MFGKCTTKSGTWLGIHAGKAWDELNLSYIQRLHMSFPRVLIDVIVHEGCLVKN